MPRIDFITATHNKTKRNYLERVTEHNKAECARVAKQFGREYWDGDRRFGYGGFRYDGRWQGVARAMAKHYGLRSNMKVLDVGCGKAFLLYDLFQEVPGLECRGIDISDYALEHAKDEMKPFLQKVPAQQLPFEDNSFDLVISITTLHNLALYDLKTALREIERVSRGRSYVVVESYRNEKEKANLLYWQLTCECFFTPAEWEWLFKEFGYTGDYSFIFFE